MPRYVRFVDEWPMSGTKIQKFELRSRIRAVLRRAHAQRQRRQAAVIVDAGRRAQ